MTGARTTSAPAVPVPVEQQSLVAGEPGLVPGQDPLQGQIRGRRAEPRWVGRAVRLHMRHAKVGERGHHSWVAGQRLGLVLRAPIVGQQPVIGVDDLDGHEPFE